MRIFFLLSLWTVALPLAAAPVTDHVLEVSLNPESHSLEVVDRISWSRAPGEVLTFELHADLEPKAEGARLERIGASSEGIPLENYRLQLEPDVRQVTLRYGGRLHHPLGESGHGLGHRQRMSPAYIGPDGVYLDPYSGWIPLFAGEPRVTFSLDTELPPGWSSISQGHRMSDGARSRWVEQQPQPGIYLVAGPYRVWEREVGAVDAQVYLREADEPLAERYLDATADYLKLYNGLMGDYPYTKLALVENLWESGYGMPSFTLLGSRVLRLPFIIGSAYPHEIVHNWWGTGVYVNYEKGNWSEGLTAYMADHLLKERQGRGAEYRRDQLQKFAAYVSKGRDFPLSEFTARHSGASQAIGYGKGLMLFHMLRLRLGDEAFLDALRHLYSVHRFTRASFGDVRRAFEKASGLELAPLFRQWLTRTGAPALRLRHIEQAQPGALDITLAQSSANGPYSLRVPVAFRLEDGRLIERDFALEARESTRTLSLPGKVGCVVVDPRFDLFRRLLPGEVPISISTLLGSERLVIVTPERAPEPVRSAYRKLANAWAKASQGVTVRSDEALHQLPDGAVWLLGWENRFRQHVSARLPAEAELHDTGLKLAGRSWRRRAESFVLTVTGSDGAPLAWMASGSAEAVTGLTRKVPHYGRYGYLVFAGQAPDNRLKGQWPATDSPLVHRFDKEIECDVPARAPLARLAEQ